MQKKIRWFTSQEESDLVAAHKLAIPFGAKNKITETNPNPNWHGHNYTLYVTVKGIP